jgi:hypothetical protein
MNAPALTQIRLGTERGIAKPETWEMMLTPREGRSASRLLLFPWIVVLGQLSGCMSEQLRFTARRTVNALPDLQYQQVVDNLAKIASNPGFLPYLAVAGQGAVQVTDNGTSTLALNIASKAFGPGNLSLGASRNVTGTWSLGTITSPEKIRSMQAVYLRALRGSAAGDPAFGWLKIGHKPHVPRQASFVGRFDDVFVWVMPEGVEGLSELSLAIMDIATREDTATPADDDKKSRRGQSEPASVQRRNFQVPPVGPVFTPGVR